jgi:hypothetical protein
MPRRRTAYTLGLNTACYTPRHLSAAPIHNDHKGVSIKFLKYIPNFKYLETTVIAFTNKLHADLIHKFQNNLSSRLLSLHKNIKIYKELYLLCIAVENLIYRLRRLHRRKVFSKQTRCREYSGLSWSKCQQSVSFFATIVIIITVIKSRRVGRAVDAACIGEIRSAYKYMIIRYQAKTP